MTLNQRLDLNAIQNAFPEAEYKPAQFPGLVFRLAKPKTATLIFSSGKMVCTGAKSEEEAVKAVKIVVKLLKRENFLIREKSITEIQNIVAPIDLHGRINLIQAASPLRTSCMSPNSSQA